MAGRLDGKVAIVTGGGQGIGGGTALRLAEEGARVLIADVDEATANERAALVRGQGGTAEVVRADMRRHDDIRAMVEHAVARFGRLDILVNNAFGPTGAGREASQGSAVDVGEPAWDAALGLLVKSMYLAAKYAIPELRRAGGGAIVNISSVHGQLYARGSMLYEVGKAAVVALTKQLAVEYGPEGIRANAICPGHIVTERQQRRWDDNPSGLRFFEAQYPLRRTGRPADIANAVAFLASDEASFITGHTLVVDGGLTLQLQENFAVDIAKYLREHPETQLPY
jgi:NAD(P)-dependent dehydrogenase (short-subunit alcohol dehydrogenase family)